MAKAKNAYRILVRKPPGKQPLGKGRKWDYNTKMDLQEVGSEEGGELMWLRIMSNG